MEIAHHRKGEYTTSKKIFACFDQDKRNPHFDIQHLCTFFSNIVSRYVRKMTYVINRMCDR